ncbi:HAD family hydrolase [Vagococcus salmoninarum]|uniref:HAD family hydrolase n=1 Tax=Vagococcus salmoninarum TaxID=2739 RepID=UPI0028D081EA|nr:HAD hydrolase family protein [Vagococcus salmoninarum]
MDIILKDSSKSVGIEKAGSLFDFTLKETVAFGDSWNDEEMLRDVGIGVAMGNAMAEIKELADYITKSNTEDGIDYALRQLKLLKKESD